MLSIRRNSKWPDSASEFTYSYSASSLVWVVYKTDVKQECNLVHPRKERCCHDYYSNETTLTPKDNTMRMSISQLWNIDSRPLRWVRHLDDNPETISNWKIQRLSTFHKDHHQDWRNKCLLYSTRAARFIVYVIVVDNLHDNREGVNWTLVTWQ